MLSRIRIPSAVALVAGLALFTSADRLAGPKLPDGDRSGESFAIHTAALVGGALIALFALGDIVRAARYPRPQPAPPTPPGPK